VKFVGRRRSHEASAYRGERLDVCRDAFVPPRELVPEDERTTSAECVFVTMLEQRDLQGAGMTEC